MPAKSPEAVARKREKARQYSRAHRERLNAAGRLRYDGLRGSGEGIAYLRQLTAESRQSKKQWLEGMKELLGCTDCGAKLPHYVLEFDHCRGVKEFSMGMMGRRSWEVLLNELDKCDVVCANCHKVREWERRDRERHQHNKAAGCLNCSQQLKKAHLTVFCSATCMAAWLRSRSRWSATAVTEVQLKLRKKAGV